MFAIVDIGGTQERVSEGQVLRVPLLRGKQVGDTVTFHRVLLKALPENEIQVGTPYLPGVSVLARVVREGREEKIRVFKMKRRKRYRRTHGHRQGYLEVEVTKIQAS